MVSLDSMNLYVFRKRIIKREFAHSTSYGGPSVWCVHCNKNVLDL